MLPIFVQFFCGFENVNKLEVHSRFSFVVPILIIDQQFIISGLFDCSFYF